MSSKSKQRSRMIFYIGSGVFMALLVVLIVILIAMIVKQNRPSDSSNKPSTPSTQTSAQQPSKGNSEESEKTETTSKPEDTQESSQESSLQEESSEEASQENSGEESSETSPSGEPFTDMETVTKSEDEIHMGILQLVNKEVKYEFLDEWLTLMYDLEGYGYYLSEYDIEMAEPAATHMNDFLNAFYDETGIMNIYMMNGYRTPEDAEFLFQRSAEQNGLEHAMMYVMRAGYSEHHIGCSSDLGLIEGGPYFEAEEGSPYYWIYDHAADYGFILRYPEHKVDITDIGAESWHFRYVSVPVANYMYKNDLCLEEFEEAIRSYGVSNPLLIDVTEGPETGSYAVYYQAGTKIQVPEDLDYIVSGNNMDGFIVVAKTK